MSFRQVNDKRTKFLREFNKFLAEDDRINVSMVNLPRLSAKRCKLLTRRTVAASIIVSKLPF